MVGRAASIAFLALKAHADDPTFELDADEVTLLQTKSQRKSQSRGRATLVDAFCHHYEWIVAEAVVAPNILCNVLPQECLDFLETEHGGLDGYCLQDTGFVPSLHEMSVYFAWTEQYCSEVADPSLLTLCVMDEDNLSTKASQTLVNIDRLVEYNSQHQQSLRHIQSACQQAFSEGGDCHHYLGDLHEDVAFVQWKTREFESPLGKFGGLVHSFLELQTVNDQKYVLEVFPLPNKERSRTWTSWRKGEPADGPGHIHAEASAASLKQGLSVADVIHHLNGNTKDYNLIGNNCHHTVGSTFKWAVPGSEETPMPNPKWSLLAESLYSAAPKAMDMLAAPLTRAGLGSCGRCQP